MKHAVYESATGRIVAVFDEAITAPLPAGCAKTAVENLDASATCLSVVAVVADEPLDAGEEGATVKPDALTFSAPKTVNCNEELLLTVQAVDGDGNPTMLETSYDIKVSWGCDVLLNEERELVAGMDVVSIAVPAKRPLMGGKEQPYSIMVSVSDGVHRGCSARVEVPEKDDGGAVVGEMGEVEP